MSSRFGISDNCMALRHFLFVLAVAVVFCGICVGGVSGADIWDGTSKDTTWAGSGTEADPYLITSAAELAGLAERVNSGNSYSGKYFKLTTDIDLNSIEWTPIGTIYESWFGRDTYHAFGGTFDGDGHVISGMKITANTSAKGYGLFGYVTGTIRNLTLTNSLIAIQGFDTITGSLVGVLEGGSVSDCSVTYATIDFSGWGGVASFITGYISGGVVGENRGGTVVAYVTEFENKLPGLTVGIISTPSIGPIVGSGGTGTVPSVPGGSTEPNLPTAYTLISSVVGEHGNITPVGETIVTPGYNLTYYFTPDSGYAIKTVLVDNIDDSVAAYDVSSECLASKSYTLSTIMNNYTVSVTYVYSPVFTITIPDSLTLSGDTKIGEMTVTAENVWIPDTDWLSILVSSENNFQFVHDADSSVKLPYLFMLVSSSQQIANNDEIMRITQSGYAADGSGSLETALRAQVTATPQYAGLYKDTLTFTVNYESP